ncbi:MAG: hypothetical protein DMF89_05110 [Acidobacteria bacterium]|nr:MAG: hypothetical protein DMF89_05110 [Acidobacteriota bacterium]
MSTSHASEPSDQLTEEVFPDSEADAVSTQPEQQSAMRVIEPPADEVFPREQSSGDDDPLLAFKTEANDTSSSWVSAKITSPTPARSLDSPSSPPPSPSSPYLNTSETLTWPGDQGLEEAEEQVAPRPRPRPQSGLAPSLRALEPSPRAPAVPHHPQPVPSRWIEETRRAAPQKVGPLAHIGGLFSRSSPPGDEPKPSARWAYLTSAVVFFGLIACAAIAFVAYELFTQAQIPTTATVAQSGTVNVNSRPAGALVAVDGVMRGDTPIKLTLPLGTHTLELRNGSEVRTVPLTVEAGTTVSQYIDLVPRNSEPAVGALEITSDPAGAEVRVDGETKGKTPLTLKDLQVGNHTVVVGKGPTSVSRPVKVTPGATASVHVSPKPEGVSAGWVSVKVPIELRVYEGSHQIGTTGADRLMMSAGRHDLELGSELLEFKTKVTVQVTPGQVTNLTLKIPNGSLSVNAAPWADVTVDGESVGVTPLANLSLPIGAHDVVWRHPELGERRRTVMVTASSPTRIGMDFRK